MKFSDVDPPIELHVEEQDGAARVVVTGHGIGMEPRAAARVFEPCFRGAPSVANAVRGCRIALPLAAD